MIYKGTEYTIELNLCADVNRWAYETLTNANFESVTLERALYQYCDMQLRLLESKPRKVRVSRELIVPGDFRVAYDYFKSTVEKGKPLLPFMSKSIVDVSFKDKMIFDWGLYHFHLSTKKDANDPRGSID